MNSATPSYVTPFIVAPFTDLRDGDGANLIYFVLSGFITRPTQPASLLISAHIASRAGRLLAIIKISSAYPQICVSLFKIVLLCSRFFSALWRTRLNNVADKPSPCLTPLRMTKGLLLRIRLCLILRIAKDTDFTDGDSSKASKLFQESKIITSLAVLT